jgi:hypothetical protein
MRPSAQYLRYSVATQWFEVRAPYFRQIANHIFINASLGNLDVQI